MAGASFTVGRTDRRSNNWERCLYADRGNGNLGSCHVGLPPGGLVSNPAGDGLTWDAVVGETVLKMPHPCPGSGGYKTKAVRKGRGVSEAESCELPKLRKSLRSFGCASADYQNRSSRWRALADGLSLD